MSEIINTLGEASARAQGLNKAVTSAQKLRNSDHSVYLMAENAGTKWVYIIEILSGNYSNEIDYNKQHDLHLNSNIYDAIK